MILNFKFSQVMFSIRFGIILLKSLPMIIDFLHYQWLLQGIAKEFVKQRIINFLVYLQLLVPYLNLILIPMIKKNVE